MSKTFDELLISDDFMFAKAMKNKKLCKQLLEVILNVKIKKIEYIEEQKSISIQKDAKSVRLDVYVADDKNTIYNIEMQATNPGNLAKRSRYYQGMIDLHLIEKGEEYNRLSKSFIIFICMQDIFGKGRNVYTFKNLCLEDTSLSLEDDTTKIFINPNGNDKDLEPELRNFLQYLKTGEATDQFTEELSNEVSKVKNNEEWRVEYMTLLMRDNEMKAEGRAEGRAEGITEGRAEGRIQQAIKMYKKFGYNQEDAIKEIMDEFSLSKEEAEEYYSKYSPSIES